MPGPSCVFANSIQEGNTCRRFRPYDEDVRAFAEVETGEATRRRFLVGAIYAIWGTIAAALSLSAAAYLLFPPKARKSDEWVEIGDITRLGENSPVEMTFRRNRTDGWRIISEKSTAWVVKSEGGVVAFGPQCTHLGCVYHWDDGKHEFICPCHNSLFAIDGKVISGPAPRPLDRYQIKTQGAKLWLGPLERPPDQKA
jgi:menaquinol-cytochrome c reductase iron-sulfur subunit